MKFKIGNYEIKRFDESNIILVEHFITKPSKIAGKILPGGEEREKVIGYYSNFEAPLKKIGVLTIDRAESKSEHATAQELSILIDNLNSGIDLAVNGFKLEQITKENK